MDIPTIPGAIYTISTASSCDVTDKASGQLLGTASSGSPFTTPAYSDALTLSDSSALYVQIKTFNFALAALGLLGGGSSTGGGSALPAGFLAAEFLESSYAQTINTGVNFANDVGVYAKAAYVQVATSGDRSIVASFNTSPIERYYALFYAPGQSAFLSGWGAYTKFTLPCTANDVLETWFNYKNSRKHKLSSATYGEEEKELTANLSAGLPICVFSSYNPNQGGYYCFSRSRVWRVEITENDDILRNYIPAIDPQGKPCMFDKVTKQPFFNSGSGAFFVGMTLEQARKLGNLPATSGTLTISLPEGYDADPAVTDAISTATANGWNITIQTYTPEAAAASSSFALRRIWVRQTPDEFGSYVDESGNRFAVEWCVAMSNTDGSEPDSHGYELFRSVDAAVAYWELAPYIDPESENLLKENTNNE